MKRILAILASSLPAAAAAAMVIAMTAKHLENQRARRSSPSLDRMLALAASQVGMSNISVYVFGRRGNQSALICISNNVAQKVIIADKIQGGDAVLDFNRVYFELIGLGCSNLVFSFYGTNQNDFSISGLRSGKLIRGTTSGDRLKVEASTDDSIAL